MLSRRDFLKLVSVFAAAIGLAGIKGDTVLQDEPILTKQVGNIDDLVDFGVNTWNLAGYTEEQVREYLSHINESGVKIVRAYIPGCFEPKIGEYHPEVLSGIYDAVRISEEMGYDIKFVISLVDFFGIIHRDNKAVRYTPDPTITKEKPAPKKESLMARVEACNDGYYNATGDMSPQERAEYLFSDKDMIQAMKDRYGNIINHEFNYNGKTISIKSSKNVVGLEIANEAGNPWPGLLYTYLGLTSYSDSCMRWFDEMSTYLKSQCPDKLTVSGTSMPDKRFRKIKDLDYITYHIYPEQLNKFGIPFADYLFNNMLSEAFMCSCHGKRVLLSEIGSSGENKYRYFDNLIEKIKDSACAKYFGCLIWHAGLSSLGTDQYHLDVSDKKNKKLFSAFQRIW